MQKVSVMWVSAIQGLRVSTKQGNNNCAVRLVSGNLRYLLTSGNLEISTGLIRNLGYLYIQAGVLNILWYEKICELAHCGSDSSTMGQDYLAPP